MDYAMNDDTDTKSAQTAQHDCDKLTFKFFDN